MEENQLATQIVDAAYRVHKELGPGLLETVYEVSLAHELQLRGLTSQRQVPIKVHYRNIRFDEGFKADLIVNNLVIIELKCVESLHQAHRKQLLTYLKLTNKRLGLLLNFSEALMKNGIIRIANQLPE